MQLPFYPGNAKTTNFRVDTDGLLIEEVIAKRRRVSRSQLYAEALGDFLARDHAESVTEQLNAVYSAARAEVDPGLRRAQLKVIKQALW